MKKPIAILSVLIIAIVGLVGVRSVVANSLSTSGVELGSTQVETKKFKKENAILKEEILKYSSLNYISSSEFLILDSRFFLLDSEPLILDFLFHNSYFLIHNLSFVFIHFFSRQIFYTSRLLYSYF